MVSDVPVGVLLSGGVDSPLVASCMNGLNYGRVRAFTIGCDDSRYDESAEARAYAEQLNLDHIVRVIGRQEALGLLDKVVDACGEPFADSSLFATLLLSQLARENVSVVLSGDGGDELFWGYWPRMSLVLEQAENFGQPRWVQWMRHGIRRYLRVGNGRQDMRFGSIGEWYLDKHTHLPGDVPVFQDVGMPEEFQDFDYSGFRAEETAQWLRWNEFRCHLPGVLLKVDRASMYHSLEVRVPLLDREVIRVAMRVDWKSCLDFSGKLGKLPLRRALARSVSRPTGPKRGFSVPMDRWLSNELRPLFEELVLNAKELLGLPLNTPAVHQLYREHMESERNRENSLWPLLSLALWERRHFRAGGVGAAAC
jgi:asparagine synthase (glutamine-hydrolysing)